VEIREINCRYVIENRVYSDKPRNSWGGEVPQP
jgi:hypothetical protein